MTTLRPEIGARLDHVSIRSDDPQRLARFFEDVYGMKHQPEGTGWRCAASGRVFFVTRGQPNSVDYFAYAFADRASLDRQRERLKTHSIALGPNLSPLFDDAAYSLTDPDGNTVLFGRLVNGAEPASEELTARLQHLALRTARIESMLTFYRDVAGFVLSDRVQDGEGTLRACFLRTDHEHHALALFGSPETRLDHISSETRDMTSLIAWADRIAAKRVPIHWGIGRHGPGNDLFFMVKDPDDNLIEISTELEQVDAARSTGVWPHEQRTLNLWGSAIMRS